MLFLADCIVEGVVKGVVLVFCFQLVLGSRGRWVSEGAVQGPKFGSMRVKQGNTLFHPRFYVLFQEGGWRVSR